MPQESQHGDCPGAQKRGCQFVIFCLHRLLLDWVSLGSQCDRLITVSNLASPAMSAAEELECILSVYSLSLQTLPAAAGTSLATPKTPLW